MSMKRIGLHLCTLEQIQAGILSFPRSIHTCQWGKSWKPWMHWLALQWLASCAGRRTCAHAHAHTHSHTCAHKHTYAHVHACAYTYTHTLQMMKAVAIQGPYISCTNHCCRTHSFQDETCMADIVWPILCGCRLYIFNGNLKCDKVDDAEAAEGLSGPTACMAPPGSLDLLREAAASFHVE